MNCVCHRDILQAESDTGKAGHQNNSPKGVASHLLYPIPGGKESCLKNDIKKLLGIRGGVVQGDSLD